MQNVPKNTRPIFSINRRTPKHPNFNQFDASALGFWVGLFIGLLLLGLLWSVLFALLVSLLAVWNDFLLLAISRVGATPQVFPNMGMPSAYDPKSNIDPPQS